MDTVDTCRFRYDLSDGEEDACLGGEGAGTRWQPCPRPAQLSGCSGAQHGQRCTALDGGLNAYIGVAADPARMGRVKGDKGARVPAEECKRGSAPIAPPIARASFAGGRAILQHCLPKMAEICPKQQESGFRNGLGHPVLVQVESVEAAAKTWASASASATASLRGGHEGHEGCPKSPLRKPQEQETGFRNGVGDPVLESGEAAAKKWASEPSSSASASVQEGQEGEARCGWHGKRKRAAADSNINPYRRAMEQVAEKRRSTVVVRNGQVSSARLLTSSKQNPYQRCVDQVRHRRLMKKSASTNIQF